MIARLFTSRFLVAFFLGQLLDASSVHAETPAPSPLPADLASPLAAFRAEGSWGWAFTQSTAADGKSLVERYDPARLDFRRWALVEKDGRAPTAQELEDYRQQQTRRSGGLTAPNVKDQIDPASAALVADDGTRATWRFGLVPGGFDDSSAAHMAVEFTLHRPTQTIERVELASFEPFSPVLGVKIKEARTTLHYTLPTGDRPTLLLNVAMRVRGRAFWFKSLDSDLTITYTDHTYAGKVVPVP